MRVFVFRTHGFSGEIYVTILTGKVDLVSILKRKVH